MGFFDLLRKPAEKKRIPSRASKKQSDVSCVLAAKDWDIPTPTSVKLITGPSTLDVFVYDASPLSNVNPRSFKMRIVYADCKLKSVYTGTEWDTSKTNDVVVAIGRMPIGTLKLSKILVERKAQTGCFLDVEAFIDGWYDRKAGIPRVRARVPEGSPFDWLAEL